MYVLRSLAVPPSASGRLHRVVAYSKFGQPGTGAAFPVGLIPLQVDSPCHSSAKHNLSDTSLLLIAPFRDMLLTPWNGPRG